MHVLALCAGIGGIERGLRRVVPGHRVVGYVEREVFAAACLVEGMAQQELDEAPIWDDIRTFPSGHYRRKVDLVTAGYPCQPFSLAGRRGGSSDPRHVWPDVLRIIRDVGAPLAYLENVQGHLSLGLDEVLADLATVGFDAEWTTVSAQEAGAPHRRNRLFILAYAGDEGLERLRSTKPGRGSVSAGEGVAVADADRELVWKLSRRSGGTSGSGEAFAGESGKELAHADCSRLEEQRRPRLPDDLQKPWSHSDGRCSWPPGPDGDWEAIDPAFRPAVPKSSVCGVADGLPSKSDRLRVLGGAVVPAQAALAWTLLVEQALS